MTACGPLCTLLGDRAESMPLPADRGRIWAAVPPLWRGGFPHPGLFAEDEKKSRINDGVASVPRLEYICPQCGQLRGLFR